MIVVIFVVHNVGAREEIFEFTKNCLNSYKETVNEENVKTFVIDNGSTDDKKMIKWVNENHPSFIVWRIEENLPLATIWNKEIDADCTDDDIVVLLNNDIVFKKQGWLEKLVDPLASSEVGISGSKLMGWNGFNFAEGAFIAFRLSNAKAIAENGKIFDEQFLFTCEEVDFCYRMERSGKRLVETGIEEQGYAEHLHHGTLSWSNHDGGFGPEHLNIHNVMHESRIKLCRKYGKEDKVDD